MQAPLSIDEVFCYATGRACTRTRRGPRCGRGSHRRTHSLTPTPPTRIGRRSRHAPTARRWAARTSSRSRAREDDVAAALRSRPPTTCRSSPGAAAPGTQGGAVPVHGGLVIDLRALDQIVEIDERSMTVTAQAGVNGDVLERALNERGLMLPHYPASSEWATVGGYVAARGSGVLSTRYGKIEDLVALAAGRAGRRRADRHRRASRATRSAPSSRSSSSARRARSGSSPARRSRSSRCRPSGASSRLQFPNVEAGIEAFRPPCAAGYRPVRHPHVRRGGDRAHVRARRRRVARGRVRRRLLRGRGGRGCRGGVPHRRARTRGGRARARPGARTALVGSPLRVLQAAPSPGAAVDLGHDRRRRAPTRTSSASTRRSRPRCATATPTRASSCGCTSRTGTAGAR